MPDDSYLKQAGTQMEREQYLKQAGKQLKEAEKASYLKKAGEQMERAQRDKKAQYNSKLVFPKGNLVDLRTTELHRAFPHPIKNAGSRERVASYLPPTSLKEMTGLPNPVETQLAPGIGAAKTTGHKSMKWKAMICKDENASMAPLKNMQIASVTTVSTKQPAQPTSSRFSATVGPRGPQGIAVTPDAGEHMFGVKNYRISNLGGSPMAPRSTRWAANVRTASGKQITTREETFKTGKVLKNKKKVVI